MLHIWGPSHQLADSKIPLHFICDKAARVQSKQWGTIKRSKSLMITVIRSRCSNLRIRRITTGGKELGLVVELMTVQLGEQWGVWIMQLPSMSMDLSGQFFFRITFCHSGLMMIEQSILPMKLDSVIWVWVHSCPHSAVSPVGSRHFEYRGCS